MEGEGGRVQFFFPTSIYVYVCISQENACGSIIFSASYHLEYYNEHFDMLYIHKHYCYLWDVLFFFPLPGLPKQTYEFGIDIVVSV